MSFQIPIGGKRWELVSPPQKKSKIFVSDENGDDILNYKISLDDKILVLNKPTKCNWVELTEKSTVHVQTKEGCFRISFTKKRKRSLNDIVELINFHPDKQHILRAAADIKRILDAKNFKIENVKGGKMRGKMKTNCVKKTKLMPRKKKIVKKIVSKMVRKIVSKIVSKMVTKEKKRKMVMRKKVRKNKRRKRYLLLPGNGIAIKSINFARNTN